MKKFIFPLIILYAFIFTACSDFLKEDPKSFISPANYYKTESQITAAVNGPYGYLNTIIDQSGIGTNLGAHLCINYLAGDCLRPEGNGKTSQEFFNLSITDENSYVDSFWSGMWTGINNCNSVIENLENLSSEVDIKESLLNQYKGEMLCLRAYYYFQLVQLWGPVPLKTTATSDLSDTSVKPAEVSEIYNQIVSDLTTAETCMSGLEWTNNSGRITKGAVKSLLAKVYLTMAGYPAKMGDQYYSKAYEKAVEVYKSNAYSLFDNYADMRDAANKNTKEFIISVQKKVADANSPVHDQMLPYPRCPEISKQGNSKGGGLAPLAVFTNSFAKGDLRNVDDGINGFFYTHHRNMDDTEDVYPTKIYDEQGPWILKFWDADGASTGESGANYSLLRYADLLLVLAESKVMADGGTTTDATALAAYNLVRSRALPDANKATSLTFDTVYKERFWELCFEAQTWFDLIRTRKAFDFSNGTIVNLIGYKAPGHNNYAYTEDCLLWPYPLHDTRLNPNLKR